VEQLSSLVEREEFGVPTCPKTLLVGGDWIEGTTLAKAQKKTLATTQ